MKKITLSVIALFTIAFVNGQNTFPSTGSAGIGTTLPDASSLLEMKSTTQGMLVPRMTKTQRDAIAVPANGLLIYQTNSTPGFYYFDGSTWNAMVPKTANKTLSNLTAPTAVNTELLAGVDNAVNLGSASFSWKDLYIDGACYLDGVKFIDNANNNTFLGNTGNTTNTGLHNTFIGNLAGRFNTSGQYNTATGDSALYTNTIGTYNTAIGSYTLAKNVNGTANTALGSGALTNNVSGACNTATGYSSQNDNTTGSFNTTTGYATLNHSTSSSYNAAFGAYALTTNTSGNSNAAFGYRSLYYNSTGHDNAATGYQTLYSNTTGDNNTVAGSYSMLSNTTGDDNTATGFSSLRENETGSENTATGNSSLYSNISGSYNIATGSYSMYSNTIGQYNTASGYESLKANTEGHSNVSEGYHSGYGNTTGYENVFVGYDAGGSNTTGYNNTFLGFSAEGSSTVHNSIAIGYQSSVTSSNKVVVGNSSVTSIGGYAGWTNFSDGRYKKNVKDNVPGLAFIAQLKPVTYTLDINGINSKLKIKASENDAKGIGDKEKKIYTGFIAQDVEATAKKLGYDFSGVDVPGNDDDYYGLRYAEFVVPLVKAVQELNKINDEIKKETAVKIDALQQQINDLKAMINNNKTGAATVATNQQAVNISSISLDQNVPNPFSHITTINYNLPVKYNSAKIIITGSGGNTIKEVTITGNGKGSLKLDASTLSAGSYQYSLYVDGKMTISKQMIMSR